MLTSWKEKAKVIQERKKEQTQKKKGSPLKPISIPLIWTKGMGHKRQESPFFFPLWGFLDFSVEYTRVPLLSLHTKGINSHLYKALSS
jgi:hypothetical protein